MIDSNKAFSTFSVGDLKTAREFYEGKLNLQITEGIMGLLELHVAGGNPVLIYPKDNHQPATFTILNFPVENIEATVDQLNSKGIKMERYAGMEHDTKGISKSQNGPAIAWFKDPYGNILSIIQDSSK